MDQNICVFGDSVTWGAWDRGGGWSARLRTFIESKSREYFVYNLGVSGDTTKELLERFDVEAKARSPQVIIFQIGDNDSIFVKSENKNLVSLEQFEKNIEKLISKAKGFTYKIIFLGTSRVEENKTRPIPWQEDFHYTNEYLELYDKKIKIIAEKNKCDYLDVHNILTVKNLDADGLHPNSKGHQKLFLRVRDFLGKGFVKV